MAPWDNCQWCGDVLETYQHRQGLGRKSWYQEFCQACGRRVR